MTELTKIHSLLIDLKKAVKQNLKLLKENEELMFKNDRNEHIIKKLQEENKSLKRLINHEEIAKRPKMSITKLDIYC